MASQMFWSGNVEGTRPPGSVCPPANMVKALAPNWRLGMALDAALEGLRSPNLARIPKMNAG